MDIQEDTLAPIVIDLGTARKGQLDESWLRMFGGWIKILLKSMFGDVDIPVKVRGTPSEIRSFAGALNGEKNYMQALQQYGLNDKKTYANKYTLNKSIEKFEKTTGLKWPFK
ncbi:MAG: hypothetical protein CMI54_00060 [Parcubacteria group bacterium]|nr:hypothetical protein [Parcubacteria group bacterium]|tara:strand:- start:568 stop:903 length:336 start_codon:yes stop_codon:yes gene_type:complete